MNGGDPIRRIAGGRVLTPDGWVEGDVLVDSGMVAGIRPAPADPPTRASGGTLDASGLLIAPGFVDLQINGAFGHDLTSAPDSVWAVGERLPSTGVTAFLPTIVSSSRETVRSALEILASGPPDGYVGAVPLGWHLEGPMLAPSRRGVHDAACLAPPSLELIDGWSRGAGVAMVTLAPELAGAHGVIDELGHRGVVVSIGHSDATFEEAAAAIDAGARSGTHLFNAMSGFHHREPGLAGALLARTDVVAGLIADGIHVHPGAVAVAWRAKGPSGVALVTDAVSPMRAEAGTAHRLGGSELERAGDAVRDRHGTLAGSTLTLDRAVRNVVAFTDAPLDTAIAAATATPAGLLGEERRGRIEPGAVADLVLLDADLEVAATIVGGRPAFRRAPEALG